MTTTLTAPTTSMFGTQIPHGTSATDALGLVGMDWTVSSEPVYLEHGKQIPSARAIVSSLGTPLAVVGPNYTPTQNSTVAGIVQRICDHAGFTLDTIGAAKNGRYLWWLLNGGETSFGGDHTLPYMLVTNSHDGKSALTVTPTSKRVICSNMIASAKRGRVSTRWLHTSGAVSDEWVDGVTDGWRSGIDADKAVSDQLASIECNHERCQRLWLAVYEDTCGTVDETDDRRKARWIDAAQTMSDTFDSERGQGCQPSMWLAYNAATNWVQHHYGRSGNSREWSTLMGRRRQISSHAIHRALSI